MKDALIRTDLDAESSNSHQLIREIEEEINTILNTEETVEKFIISSDISMPKTEKAMMDLYQIISPILVNYSGDALLKKIRIISGCIATYVDSTCAKIRNIEKIQLKKDMPSVLISSLVNAMKKMKECTTEDLHPTIDRMIKYCSEKLHPVAAATELENLIAAEATLPDQQKAQQQTL